MTIYFVCIISFLIAQRLLELAISHRNERWLRQHGAIEYGQKHYPFIIALHSFFLISLIVEYWINPSDKVDLFFLIFYIIMAALKYLIITSLGRYWNTKIFRIPNSPAIRTGLYRWIRHPNYVVVVGEIFAIPMIFHLYFTAIVFSLINGIMLWIRIGMENAVWNEKQNV